MSVHVLVKTWEMVISRRRFVENLKEMHGIKKSTWRACKSFLFVNSVCKFSGVVAAVASLILNSLMTLFARAQCCSMRKSRTRSRSRPRNLKLSKTKGWWTDVESSRAWNCAMIVAVGDVWTRKWKLGISHIKLYFAPPFWTHLAAQARRRIDSKLVCIM